ncbi:MAG: C25 family cysteine peptidase [Planctomycetota bacterium]|nr:C25 family cysteine peptidase [Planctomycetota bacterium]
MLANRHFLLLACMLLGGIFLPLSSNADVLVICPDVFKDAIGQWIEYRTGQGYHVVPMASNRSATLLQKNIRNYAANHSVAAVVLIGDTGPVNKNRISSDAYTHRYVPTHYRKATVIAPYAGDQQIATDNPFGDLDGDDIAEIPVGRLAVDTPTDLMQLIQRIIAYESASDFSDWRRKINLVAGVGEFGPLVDSLIEGTTRTFLISKIPPAYQTSMTQANWKSPYCPPPEKFRDTVLNRLNEGCLFWIYLGHGQIDSLDRVRVPDGQFSILKRTDAEHLAAIRGAPIALLCCCYAAAFDAPDDCLAEAMLQSKAGPIAVIGGSRTTMPYAMTVLGNALIDQYFQKRQTTLGEILTNAKRNMVNEDAVRGNRIWLDRLAGLLGNTAHLRAAERTEHAQLFNLLGDPLLKISTGQPVAVRAPRLVDQGAAVAVEIDTPVEGLATVELVARRGSFTAPLADRTHYDATLNGRKEYLETYLRANDQRLDQQQWSVSSGLRTFTLQLPPDFSGPCHARIYIEGVHQCALGATDLYVQQRKSREGSAE